MTEPTPGPWKVRADGEEESLTLAICAPWSTTVKPGDAPGWGDYRGVLVARVSWPPNDFSEPTAQANARLIAAAPDLLEAAEAALELVSLARNYFPKSVQNSDRFRLENINAAIGAAIAKAKEGQA